VADALDIPEANGNSTEARAQALIDYLEGLAVTVKAPRKLRELDIAQEATTELAEAAMLQTRLLINNPKTLELADAKRIYEAAW